MVVTGLVEGNAALQVEKRWFRQASVEFIQRFTR